MVDRNLTLQDAGADVAAAQALLNRSGALLDTEALVSALENGSLGGAALDVLEGEEGIFYADLRNRPVGSELLLRLQAMPNVLISPHAAFYTDHAVTDMVENTLVNCLSFEKRSRCA